MPHGFPNKKVAQSSRVYSLGKASVRKNHVIYRMSFVTALNHVPLRETPLQAIPKLQEKCFLGILGVRSNLAPCSIARFHDLGETTPVLDSLCRVDILFTGLCN